MAAKILEDFLKSINFENEDKIAPLQKSVEEGENSISDMLSKIDDTTELQKMSNIPELADEKAAEEAADHTDDVFSVEDEKEAVGANTDSSHDAESNIPENASAKAKEEAANATDDVFSVERTIDGNGAKEPNTAEVTRPNSANKSNNQHVDKQDLVKKDDKKEEEDEDDEMDKSKYMKKSETKDVDWFDASEPLKQLAKSMEAMTEKMDNLEKKLEAKDEVIKELFKSIATVSVKGFQLQKSIAGALDTMSEEPNKPKGMINVMHKSFEQNEGQEQVSRPHSSEFADVLIKGIEIGAIDPNLATNAISKVDVSGMVDDNSLEIYNLCKKQIK